MIRYIHTYIHTKTDFSVENNGYVLREKGLGKSFKSLGQNSDIFLVHQSTHECSFIYVFNLYKTF
jgi:hypothetical protein